MNIAELVEKLRLSARGLGSEDPANYMARGISAGDCIAAATTIETLLADNLAMRAALIRTLVVCKYVQSKPDAYDDEFGRLLALDIAAARAALGHGGDDGKGEDRGCGWSNR